MGDGIAKRRKKGFTWKKIVVIFILLLGVVALGGTIAYTIPQLSKYVTRQWYISPLATGFSFQTSSEKRITEAVVKEKLQKKGFQVKTITDTADGYIILLKTGEKIIFSQSKPLDQQISSLQLISSRFTIEGKHFVSLDLRFDWPVLVAK